MAISTKLIRMQISFLKTFTGSLKIDTARLGQEKLGEFMASTHKSKVRYSLQEFSSFQAEWVIPKMEKQSGVLLYLHGGGYVSGDIAYAKGFGTILAAKNNIRVFCVAYRLAPEHPFPAALEDSLAAYQYLLDCGYDAEKIILCGESAGGGLLYALTIKLKEQALPLPGGLIAISPWTDLTLSGKSHISNSKNDPSLETARLHYYASLYTDDVTNPLVSPLFGDLSSFPPSLLFVGGDEILLDDAVKLHEKLIEYGNLSELVVTPKLWHAYILYGIAESKMDHAKISEFIVEILHETEKIEMDAT